MEHERGATASELAPGRAPGAFRSRPARDDATAVTVGDDDVEPLAWEAPPAAPGARPRPPRSGRRRGAPCDRPPGRYVRARPARGGELALDATLRAAAVAACAGRAPRVTADDLRDKVRVRRTGRLLVLVVDLSGSMGTDLLALTRRAAAELLAHAYLERDRVAVVGFRERRAEVLLAPTRAVELARRRLDALPVGGRTPLAAGLREGRAVVARARALEARLDPVVVVISDGKANVGARPGYASVLAEVERAAAALRDDPGVRVVVLDATEAGKDPRPARRLAVALGAPSIEVHRLRDLPAGRLRELLRRI